MGERKNAWGFGDLGTWGINYLPTSRTDKACLVSSLSPYLPIYHSKFRSPIENWAAAGHIQQDEKGKYGLISAFRYQLESLQVKLARTKLLLEEAQDIAVR